MHVILDAETCQGHGRCYVLAPELFDCDDEGRGVVRASGDVPDDLLHAAQVAVDNCPESAISLVESDDP